jgi:ESS family glutamate:Na+ symporter
MSGIRLKDFKVLTAIPVNSFLVLGCGAVAIAVAYGLHARVAVLRRCLIPPAVVAGLILAAPTLLLRRQGIAIEVDGTLQQLAMVALFTSVGFTLDREALRRGGRPVLILLGAFWFGAIAQNAVGVTLARGLGLHPLLGIAGGAIAFAGGPATSLAFGPTIEEAGAAGATSAAVALAITGILIGGFTTGAFGAFLIYRDRLQPNAVGGVAAAAAMVTSPERARDLSRTVVLFGIAMGAGYLINLAINHSLRPLAITLPAYTGAMLAASLIRIALPAAPAWNTVIGALALTWFIPLALWTLRYWELAGLAAPLVVILLVQTVVTLGLGWSAYRLVGRTFDSAFMAAGYYGFMIGTMANSFAGMEEMQRRFGASPHAMLVIPIVGGVLSDFVNIGTIIAFRAWLA